MRTKQWSIYAISEKAAEGETMAGLRALAKCGRRAPRGLGQARLGCGGYGARIYDATDANVSPAQLQSMLLVPEIYGSTPF